MSQLKERLAGGVSDTCNVHADLDDDTDTDSQAQNGSTHRCHFYPSPALTFNTTDQKSGEKLL